MSRDLRLWFDDAHSAYVAVGQLNDAIGAINVAAQSSTHPLELPAAAVARLVEARQALMAAHREIEKVVHGAAPERLCSDRAWCALSRGHAGRHKRRLDKQR
jgi:hypothetical protein